MKYGRRPDSRAREATGPSARLRRCGHRTRRDPRRRCRLRVGHGVDSGPRRATRGTNCRGFNTRTTRIAAHQHRHRATHDSASLCAAGGNSDLSQLVGRRARPGRSSTARPGICGRVGQPRDRCCGRFRQLLRSGYAIAAIGSTVVGELALRPGFSPQARMPPTARCASRGERCGLLVLTAGPVSCSTGVTPPARWPRPNPVERAAVSRPLPLRVVPTEGWEGV